MKKKYAAFFVFILAALACASFAGCDNFSMKNPIMETWWEESDPVIEYILKEVPAKSVCYVSFDTRGGGYIDLTEPIEPTPKTQIVAVGKTALDPGLVVKTGSYLAGWYTAAGERWDFANHPVTEDITLYAKWEPSGYTVKFDLNLPSRLTSAEVSYVPVDELIAENARAVEPREFGLLISQTGDIAAIEHGFRGWYTEAACETLWDFNRLVTNADVASRTLTLYAGWGSYTGSPETSTPQTPQGTLYAILWDVGNAYEAPMPQVVYEGQKIATPLPAINPGYAFDGWYLDAGFSNRWDFDTPINDGMKILPSRFSNKETIILYAKWHVPDMIWVGGGSVTLGGPSSEYPNTSPNPTVTLSDFFIGETEVPNWKFRDVMGYIPSHWNGENNPVDQVTWYDAVMFCNMLSMKEGLTPFYDIDNIVYGYYGDTKYIQSATVTVSGGVWRGPNEYFKDGYRLPTEAEWEYAARGGAASRGYRYAGSDNIDEVAWHNGNSASAPHPVKGKAPNELGIYDMSGNLSEWCWDLYNSTIYGSYAGAADPRNDSNSSKNPEERVRRGGNWNMLDVKTRSRTNNNANPTFSWVPAPADGDLKRYWTIGFRVARNLRPAMP